MFDFSELIKRALKYLIEGFMVAIAAYAIPKQSLKLEEVMVIALTAAATFAVLDVFAECMRKAFGYFFEDSVGASKDIRLDCDTWSLDYDYKDYKTPGGMTCKGQNVYIDSRSKKEYERFKKYM